MRYIVVILMCFCLISCSSDETSVSSTTGGGDDNSGGEIYPYTNSVGFSANDILSGNVYSNLVLDIMYVDGYQPTSQAVSKLVDFISDRTFKTNITVSMRQIPTPSISTYTTANVRDIEDENRIHFTAGNTMTISALFLNGSSASNSGNSVVLGTAYRNTSFVIYEETIHQLSNSPLEPNRVILESTVILHELCHLLGLVNVGTTMVEDHQDTAHGAHCVTQNCLMYYAVENGNSISDMLSGGQVPELDSFCLQDLQNNGGK